MFGGQRHAPVKALRSVLPKTSTISRAWRSLSSFRRRLRAIKEQNSTSLKVLITGALICRSASSAVGLGDYDKAGADGRRRTPVHCCNSQWKLRPYIGSTLHCGVSVRRSGAGRSRGASQERECGDGRCRLRFSWSAPGPDHSLTSTLAISIDRC